MGDPQGERVGVWGPAKPRLIPSQDKLNSWRNNLILARPLGTTVRVHGAVPVLGLQMRGCRCHAPHGKCP